jgi:hypothetical protein
LHLGQRPYSLNRAWIPWCRKWNSTVKGKLACPRCGLISAERLCSPEMWRVKHFRAQVLAVCGQPNT